MRLAAGVDAAQQARVAKPVARLHLVPALEALQRRLGGLLHVRVVRQTQQGGDFIYHHKIDSKMMMVEALAELLNVQADMGNVA